MKLIRIGSVTTAQRARELLAAKGIRARVRRLDSSAEGCTRALEVDEAQAAAAVRLLSAAGISAKEITGAGK